MWSYFENALSEVFDAFSRFDREQWIMIFCLALIIGFFCLRGFGSRSTY